MQKKRIYLSPTHMGGAEIDYVHEAFDTNWISPFGPNLTLFEKKVCEYVGMEHAVAVTSGTSAIHLALKYIGVKQGDYVFCQDLTFAASCNSIVYEKAIPVFIDSEYESYNMSPVALEKAFEKAEKEGKMPKAVVIVDLYGQSADYDRLLEICNRYSVPIVEDAAESLGSEYDGRKCGTFGYINIFSFNGNKIITTSGGGMAVSNDGEAVKKMHFWANQSREPGSFYLHKELGYNYRLSNICAGIGCGQMEVLPERVARRREIFEYYKKALSDLPIEMMPVPEKSKPNFWLSVFTINKGCNITPDEVVSRLEQENIEGRRFWNPMHNQPIFKDYEFVTHLEVGSVSDDLFFRGVCLPSGSSMTDDDIDRVVKVLRNIFIK